MLKQWRIGLILMVVMAFGILISACGGSSNSGSSSSSSSSSGSSSSPTTLGTPGSYNCVSGSITAAGSTALQPLVSAVAKQYEAKCSGASITVNLGGSGTGLANAENGSVDIGNSDIFAKSGQEDLVDHHVAVVVFNLVLNSKVTGVSSLTTAQLKQIYSGQATNWSQFGGPSLPIVVVSRPTSSGTRATFQKYVLGTVESVTGPSNLTTDSTGTVIKNVEQTAGAIGYAASAAAKKSGLTILKIDNVEATSDNVKNNTYKFWNIEHMYTKGKPKDLAQALIDYMTSPDVKDIVQSLGFIPITDMPKSSLQTRQSH
ncbi:MAG TPA: phosphate ABC transporter substrate-binding protein [Ktedonobacteraceae bacterium]|nr:phosphate ABC transporter substrate-binding protein [Ktedonobacteraceae bacterium]